MKKITLNKLSLTNFKGFAKIEKFFGAREEICAENGQGKTTLRDAWFWLLGFNVSDVIPSVDNKEIPNLEIKVEAEITIEDKNGTSTYIFTREQKEVRKTNKNTGIDEKMNNESSYSIDTVPFILRGYKDKISQVFGVPYEKLQMLCQKEFFNADNDKWKWNNRRKELFDICDVSELLTTIVNKECYSLIAPSIRKGQSTTEIKKAIKKELAGYSDEKDKNTILIADKQNEMAKYSSYDFAALESEKAALETKITETMLNNARQTVNNELERLQGEKSELNSKIYAIKAEHAQTQAKTNEKTEFIKNELATVQTRAENLKQEMKSANSLIEVLEKQNEELEKEEWNGDTFCPTCKQPLPVNTVEESKRRYLDSKAQKIEINLKKIDDSIEFLKTAKRQLDDFRETYIALRSQLTEYEKLLSELKIEDKIKPYLDRVSELDAEINRYTKKDSDKTDLTSIVEPMRKRVAEINSLIGYKRIVADFASRVEQLKSRNKDITDQEMLAKTKVRQLDEYVREQVKLVTDVINVKFRNSVRFSLFTDLYANSEHEIKEECLCVLNGKTYNEMSYGERFFADIEVTKTLQAEYGVNLPIFLDNAECYTGDVSAEQQLIMLYARKGQYLDGVMIEVIL